MHIDHESLRFLKTCPGPVTQQLAGWLYFLQEYNLTLWYVAGLDNPAADSCSRLTSRQLMDTKNATPTRAFVVPLVQNCISLEGKPVDEFLHMLEDLFSGDKVWRQPCDHLYVSLRSGRSVGNDPDVDIEAEPALQFGTEPAVEPEKLKPLPTDEALAEDSHEPAVHLEDAVNERPDKSSDTDHLPESDMDRPIRVPFGKEIRFAPTSTELIRCRQYNRQYAAAYILTQN